MAPGKECEHRLTARRGESHKSLTPEKGKAVDYYSSRDKKLISPQNKTKYSPRVFTNNGSGDKGIAFDKQEGSQQCKMHNTAIALMKVSNDFSIVGFTQRCKVGTEVTKGLSLQHQKIYEGMIFYLMITVDLLIQVLTKNRVLFDITTWLYLVLLIVMVCFNIGICTFCEGSFANAKKYYKTMETKRLVDCVILVSGLFAEEATVKILTFNSDIFACKSKHDLMTQIFCQIMWRWFAFCAYNVCHFTCHSSFLIPNGFQKHILALISTFIGWTSAWTRTFAPAIRHTTTHVLLSNSHIPAPHVMQAKFQRKRFFKRSSTTMMLAVMITVSTIARSQAQKVSPQF